MVGCQGINLTLNVDDPKNYVTTEVWDSKEHYEKYLAFRTEDGTVDNITGMSEEGPDIRIFYIKEALKSSFGQNCLYRSAMEALFCKGV